MGIERMILLLQEARRQTREAPLAYVVHAGEAAAPLARRIADTLRDAGHAAVIHAGGGTFRAQMKRADASGARYALIVGDDEAAKGTVSVKPLRESGEQFAVAASDIVSRLAVSIGPPGNGAI
jgi:histidyl-tRNA synthetase